MTEAPAPPNAQIVCDNLVRIFRSGDIEVVALQGLDLLVERGELVAIVGASGSGKSTLLGILAGLDTPSAGVVHVGGHDLSALTPVERTRYRRSVCGMVWQQTAQNLLPYLTAAENVELPMSLSGTRRSVRRHRTRELLDLVAVAHRAGDRPATMSGGEQQRVAIAVALANEPELLLADEPTGELDSRTSEEVFEVLRTVNRETGTTVVIVTHDPAVMQQVNRTVRIRDGRTSTETLRRSDGSGHVAEEFAVLDRAGRLQLPADFVAALELRRRVRLALEPDHIGVWPDRQEEA